MDTSSSPATIGTSKPALPPVASYLPSGLPTPNELFAFAADAERRLRTLRLRIDERSVTTDGESVTRTELLVDRPHVRVTTSTRSGSNSGSNSNYEVWTTDGAIVEQYDAKSNTATRRPHRAAPAGLDDAELPATVSMPRTLGPLPSEGWVTTLLRPHHFCANTLSSATLGPVSEETHLGRAVLAIEAAAPHTIDLAGAHATFRYRVLFDRVTGLLLSVTELHDERVVRETIVSAITLDADIPASEFIIELPAGARKIY